MNKTEKDRMNVVEKKIQALCEAFLGSDLRPNGFIDRLEKSNKRIRRVEWIGAGTLLYMLLGDKIETLFPLLSTFINHF